MQKEPMDYIFHVIIVLFCQVPPLLNGHCFKHKFLYLQHINGVKLMQKGEKSESGTLATKIGS